MTALPAAFECCDYDPIARRGRTEDGGCRRVAVWSIGVKRNWHLCDDCANLPEFRLLRKRTLLSQEEDCA